jgi:hypothetical protein
MTKVGYGSLHMLNLIRPQSDMGANALMSAVCEL